MTPLTLVQRGGGEVLTPLGGNSTPYGEYAEDNRAQRTQGKIPVDLGVRRGAVPTGSLSVGAANRCSGTPSRTNKTCARYDRAVARARWVLGACRSRSDPPNEGDRPASAPTASFGYLSSELVNKSEW
jgi:hypothetical protein